MPGRLQLIEQGLTAIDPAGFQNLCDAYLVLRESKYSSLNRTGSQLGKQKTKSGTPDSFVRLDDNRLAYIEYTTQAESKVAKIKGDIDSCLDESKTEVSTDELNLIIVCFNSRLTVKEEIDIQKYANQKNIDIELIGIDTLALEIFSNHPLLSRDFLGISIDTGQILPLDRFIEEYNNKAIQLSTPLDNDFLHRKDELEMILNYLETSDLLILSGAPGVGKTKIALESIKNFIENNASYTSFAVSNKGPGIFEDLRIQLHPEKNYILLIDDANRQLSNLMQILGLFKEKRKGKIKIIITVRNYALNDICKQIGNLDREVIELTKFTDEEITEIISSNSFKILNEHYQDKIKELSDGNARLAVMAARLANEKQTDFLYGDVIELFDLYFNTFISDFDLFEDKTVLKILGIISFFFTIDRKDKEFIYSICDLFNIDYYAFNEAIEDLHRRELVEILFDHVRISEQVMATYFFYKVFIKDELLPFSVLLNNYFSKWKSRFKDSIIPANNSFGYENVITKIDSDLSEYLQSISGQEDCILNFLDLFWFYMPEDTIAYFYEKTSKLSEPVSPIYLTHYETNDFIYNKNQTLDFITRFFGHSTECLKPSVELGFEYVRKKPEHLPEFIKRVKEKLKFDESDEKLGFKRQVEFIDIVVDNINQDKPHYISTFFALAGFFLKHKYHITHARRNHRIIWYDYQVPFYDVTRELRAKVWNTIFAKYDSYPKKVFDIIKNFNPIGSGLVPEIMDYDLSLLVPFISKKLSPSIFKHAHYVQEMIYWNDTKKEITNRSYRNLKEDFLTEEYLAFCKLDWNKLRDKDEFEYEYGSDEYDSFKTEEIKKHFTFKSENEFEKLIIAIENYKTINKTKFFSIGHPIDIVVENNFIQNNELGFKLLTLILNNYPKGLRFLYRTVHSITNHSEDSCLKLWQILEDWNDENALFWKTTFFNYVPKEFINDFYCEKLAHTIDSIDKPIPLHLEVYARYNLVDKNIIKTILSRVAQIVEELDIDLTYSEMIFKNHLDFFESDYDLIKKSYYQQFKHSSSQIFDYNGKGFETIFSLYPKFLFDFIHQYYSENAEIEPKINFWLFRSD